MRFGYLTSANLEAVYAWARRLVDDLNRTTTSVEDLPIYSDDDAARSAGVTAYVAPDGSVRRVL